MAKKSTAAKKPTSKRPAAKRRASTQDAVMLLKTDHEKVQSMFDRYEKARGDDMKTKLAQQICAELTVHAQVEEEIFYPAVKEAIKQTELLDEATVEHKTAKDLIAEIQAGAPGDDLFDAKVKVLGEYIKHHVKEEQGQMFPAARKSALDLKALGGQIADRKKALSAEVKPAANGAKPKYPFPT